MNYLAQNIDNNTVKSLGLEESKQARFLPKAEDVGLCYIEFYSAGKNPNDLLVQFSFLFFFFN